MNYKLTWTVSEILAVWNGKVKMILILKVKLWNYTKLSKHIQSSRPSQKFAQHEIAHYPMAHESPYADMDSSFNIL